MLRFYVTAHQKNMVICATKPSNYYLSPIRIAQLFIVWDQSKGRVAGLGITLYLYIYIYIRKKAPWKLWLPGIRYRSLMDFKPAVNENVIIVFINTLMWKSYVIQIRHPKIQLHTHMDLHSDNAKIGFGLP